MLVVDDEPTIRAVIQRMLMLRGLCSIAVPDDIEAVDAAKQESFAGFIIDLHLQNGRSGLDLLQRLRLETAATAAPVFILTGQRDLAPQQEKVLRDHRAHVFFKGESLLRLVDRLKAEITKTL